MFETHLNAELRKTVREVGRSIQRIDIPAIFPLQAVTGSLFAVDPVIGKNLAEARANQLFGRPVGDSHHIDVAFVFCLDTLREKLPQTRACLTGNL